MNRLLITLLVFISFFISGCGHKETVHRKKTIKWAFWGDPKATGMYQSIVDDFEKGFPDIEVKLMQIPGNAYGEKIKILMAGGTAPDIMWLGEVDLASYVKRGALLGLKQFAEKDTEFNLSDFYPNVLDAYHIDGILYGIPKGINIDVIFYNKTMFDKTGIKYPGKEWTWDGFMETARRLTRYTDGNKRIDQFGFGGWEYSWWQFVWQNGGEIINDGTKKCEIASTVAIEALEFWKDLFYKHHVMPTPYEAIELANEMAFKMGKIGMLDWSHPGVFQFRQVKDFDWDIASLPKGRKRVVLFTSGCFSISSQSRNPESAWKFISYITRLPAAGKYFTTFGEEMSPRKSLSHIQDEPDKPPHNHRIFFEEVEHAKPLPTRYSNYMEIKRIIFSELELAWLDKEPVKTICARIKPKVDQLLRER